MRRHLSWRGIAAGLGVACALLIAACTPVVVDVPTPTPEQPAPAASTDCLVVTQDGTLAECSAYAATLTPALRAIACDPIVAFDRAEAGRQTRETDNRAAWTLGFGFRTALEGRPLGCLRLYHLTESTSPWGAPEPVLEPVDGGGILIDTCTLQGPSFDPTQGYASFCGAGAISCTINLAGWFTNPDVLALVAKTPRGQADADAAAAIEDLAAAAPEADYPSLTFVASVGWAEPGVAPECALQGNLQPIFTVVTEGEREYDSFALRHADMGVDWADAACTNTRWLPGLGWNVAYASRLMGDDGLTTVYQTLTKTPGVLPRSASSCFTATPDQPLRAWLGPATLQIGAGGGERFTGYMQGILIDPPNSKPPTRLRVD